MEGTRSPSSPPPPSRPKRGLSRPDAETPAAIAAWEAEIVERTHRDHQERRLRQGSSGGDSNSNISVSWADQRNSSPRIPTSPGSVSRRGYIQDPLPPASPSASTSNPSASIIKTTNGSRPNIAGSDATRSRRSESINSIGKASTPLGSPRSPPPTSPSGFIDYSSKRRSSVASSGSAGGTAAVNFDNGSVAGKQQQLPIAVAVPPTSSQKPSFLEEYGLELEDPARTSSSTSAPAGRNPSRFRGLIGSKDRSSSGTLSPPPIPRISSPLAPSLTGSDSPNLALLATPTAATQSQSLHPVASGTTFSGDEDQSSRPEASPTSSSRPRLDSDASYYPPEDIPIFRGTNTSQSVPSTASRANGSESVSSHTSSDARVRGESTNALPQTEVDLVRLALASRRDGSGSLEYDYSDLVENTSEFSHTKESSSASAPSAPADLPPLLPARNKSAQSSSSSFDRGMTSGVEINQGPPALPRRPNQNRTSSPETSIASHVETKTEKKEREAAEKSAMKNEKLRVKEEANAENQRLKDEAARVKQEAIAIKAKEKTDAKREKERLKWRKEKKKNEDVERSILEASVEELEIAQFLNSFGKNVREVRAVAPLEPDEAAEVEWPRRADWMSNGGGILANVGYSVAVLTAIACYLSPRGPTQITIPEARSATSNGDQAQDSSTIPTSSETLPSSAEDNEEHFSLDALQSNGERLYLTALPMYESLLSALLSLGRWDRPLVTAPTFLAYSVLWWNGLLLPGFFALMIFFTLKLKAVPIKPDALRKIIALQNKRQNELKDFENGLKEVGGAKALLEEAEKVDIAENQNERNINDEASATSHSTDDAKAESDLSSTGAKVSRGKYSLAADATKKYGTILTYHASNLADLHERIKNFFHWKSPSATTRSLCWLLILMFSTLFLSPQILIRIPGAALGIAFFFILPIAQRKPDWLPVMANPIELLLAGVPNDAQCAINLMRRRALHGQPLIGDQRLLISPEFLKNHELFANEGMSGMHEESITDDQVDAMLEKTSLDGESGKAQSFKGSKWSQWKSNIEKGRDMAIKGSEMFNGQRAISLGRLSTQDQGAGAYGFLARNINTGLTFGEKFHREKFGSKALQSSSDSNAMALKEADLINQPDGYFFSMLNGVSGHLVVGNHKIVFKSIFSQKSNNSTSITSDEKINLNSPEIELDVQRNKMQKEIKQQSRILIEVNLEQILMLRKTKSLNLVVWSTDGLIIKLKNRETLAFSNMLKRDEAFNRILALAPSHWERSK